MKFLNYGHPVFQIIIIAMFIACTIFGIQIYRSWHNNWGMKVSAGSIYYQSFKGGDMDNPFRSNKIDTVKVVEIKKDYVKYIVKHGENPYYTTSSIKQFQEHSRYMGSEQALLFYVFFREPKSPIIYEVK